MIGRLIKSWLVQIQNVRIVLLIGFQYFLKSKYPTFLKSIQIILSHRAKLMNA